MENPRTKNYNKKRSSFGDVGRLDCIPDELDPSGKGTPPQLPVLSLTASSCRASKKRIKRMCLGRESNPGQLVGNQLLYH